MSPRRHADNIWELYLGEQIVGHNGTIEGPTLVRVQIWPQYNLMQVQSDNTKIQVEGTNVPSVVSQKER